MRTTITLDPDVAGLVKTAMKERRVSFKTAVNDAIRSALQSARSPFETPTFSMGNPAVDLTKALAIAAELEDRELVRKLELRK
jgi:hypothetical protein